MLSNLTLVVSDVERSRAFYTMMFGLTETGSSAPGMALLNAGIGLTLLLQPPEAVNVSPVPGGMELGFEVADLDETRARLLEQGVEVGEAVQMGWSGGFDARDPDGHALSIFKKGGRSMTAPLDSRSDLAFLVAQTQQMRSALFAFLNTVPPEVLMVSRPEYGQGGVLSTLTHVVDSYGGWVGRTLLEQDWAPAEVPDDLPALTERFGRVDALLTQALVSPRMRSGEPFIRVDPDGNTREVTARWTVMHPLTHEFHHKGQVVTLLRKLGHPVTVDLDLPPPGGW